MLPDGWSSSYSKEGETLSVWKYFPKYVINLEAEPRIKLIDMVKGQFEAKGKELSALMKNAEKNCKTLEYKHFSQEQEDLMTKVFELRRAEEASKPKLLVVNKLTDNKHWFNRLKPFVKSLVMRYTWFK